MKDRTRIEVWDLLERLKDFVIRTVIVILIVICIGMIFNGLGKIKESLSPYRGEFFRPVEVIDGSGNFMNCYLKDMKAQTIVILSEHGEVAPVIKYKALADELSSDYRVVVAENFGYSFSSDVESERTNETIATEIKDMLDALSIPKPFVLVSNNESMLYAMKMQSMFPEYVDVMINVDGLYPSYINDTYVQNSIQKKLSNEKATYYIEKTGIETVLSYAKPSTFGIDKMKKMSNYYSDKEIYVYRNRISNNFFSKMKISETAKLQDNMKEMLTYEYPAELGTLSILSSGKIEEYNKLKSAKQVTNDYESAASAIITNPDIQKVVTINGAHGLEISNVVEEANQIKDFLNEYFGINNENHDEEEVVE
ncbi:MAG: hypothetical protein K6D97_08775 [Clostridia bacterium]|nr:hypothetical protein [Clostridia bacterium]